MAPFVALGSRTTILISQQLKFLIDVVTIALLYFLINASLPLFYTLIDFCLLSGNWRPLIYAASQKAATLTA